MRNIRIDLAYDGTDFDGWQIQPRRRTVQAEVERALARILGEGIRVHGSGRTDAGVHALRQVAQFRSATALPSGTLARALRALLPEDVHVLSVADARPDFDARRHATSRSSRYRILVGRDPFLRRFAWELRSRPDLGLMQAGARHLLGPIDGTSFADASRKGRSNEVRVDRSEWREEGPELLYEIRANRFIHHMVRTIVGTLVGVGRGARPPEEIPSLIAARDRRLAGPTAPARGLTLVEVCYPDGWAARPAEGEADEVLP
jgi:tRNA pseudouridine38-40 synthase